MKIALYTNIVIHHQLPLAREIVRAVGVNKYRYIYRFDVPEDRRKQGYCGEVSEKWILSSKDDESFGWLLRADCLISGERDVKLFEQRASNRLLTLYTSERWFKPPWGILRLLSPTFFTTARRIVRLLQHCENFLYLPIGIYAARDMARLVGLFSGDMKCLFMAPNIMVEKQPGGYVWLQSKAPKQRNDRYCLGKMRLWGYFVERSMYSGSSDTTRASKDAKLKILWVGRLLKWKRVEDIIHAIHNHKQFELDIYGFGPREKFLKQLAGSLSAMVNFHAPVPSDEIRKIMRDSDVYVLPSNAQEGWGAVISEALEEGMKVIGTFEAGSSATILPNTNLFHAGKWQELERLLLSPIHSADIGSWTAVCARRALFQIIEQWQRKTCNDYTSC